jgi:hypothetical protein
VARGPEAHAFGDPDMTSLSSEYERGASPALPAARLAGFFPPRLRGALGRHLLDGTILIYALSTAAVLAFGGFDIGFFSATTAAKPLLTLAILIPLRVAIAGPASIVRPFKPLQRPADTAEAITDVTRMLPFVVLATVLVAFIGSAILPPARPPSFAAPGPWPYLGQILAAWDSGWYWDIAVRGYYYYPDRPSSLAFFPLYPMLMRAAAWPFGGGPSATFWAGIVVSWLSLFGGLVLLHRYTVALTGDRNVAGRTVLILLVFPFSFYFLRIYTESLFLLLTIGAFYAAHRQAWWLAGVAGALAALTRPNGILIVLPLAIMAIGGAGSLRVVIERWAKLTPIPLALGAFCVFSYSLAEDPLAWLNAQQHWNYAIDRLPHRHLLRTFSAIEEHGLSAELRRSANAPVEFLYTVVTMIFLATVPFIWRRLGAASAVYVAVSLLIPMSGTTFEGMGRYASVLFPAFIIAGTIRSRGLFESLVVLSCVLLALCTILFVGWYPLQ